MILCDIAVFVNELLGLKYIGYDVAAFAPAHAILPVNRYILSVSPFKLENVIVSAAAPVTY